MTEAIADIDIVDIDEFAAERGFKKLLPPLPAQLAATKKADEIIAKLHQARVERISLSVLVEWLDVVHGVVTSTSALSNYLRGR